MKADWNTTDRILYGIMCGGMALWAIATFIEACRSRPKVQMIVLGVSGKVKDKSKGESDDKLD